MRDSFSPSARLTWASASASAGRIVVAMSSFCLRSASSWASSVCFRTTSWVASAWASGPDWAALASAACVSASTSAWRSETSRWALSLICCDSASRTAASWSAVALAMRASRSRRAVSCWPMRSM